MHKHYRRRSYQHYQKARVWLNTFFDEELKVEGALWKRDDHPLIARWIDANEKPLESVIEASRRSEYFVPALKSDEPMLLETFDVRLLNAQRLAARMLRMRAMWKIDQGDMESAWVDLHSIRRLARLSARGPRSFHQLFSAALDDIASRDQKMLIEHATLTSIQAATFRKQLDAVPNVPPVGHYLEPGERFAVLDLMCRFAQLGPELSKSLETANLEDLLPAASNNIDWNVVLRTINNWRDRFTAATIISDESKRRFELSFLNSELDAASEFAKDRAASMAAELSPRVAGEAFGDLAAKTFMSTNIGPPGWSLRRVQTTDALFKVALAIGQFKADHGKLPETLDALVPTYFEKVPLDPATATDFVYRITAKGYLLYGLGPNGQDDGGTTYGDGLATTTLTADDAVIEVPPRPRPKPAPPATDSNAVEGEEAAIAVE